MSFQHPESHTKSVKIDMNPVDHQRHPTYKQYVSYHHQARHDVPKVAPVSDFVYVNAAYVGSVNNINENRLQAAPTSVIREQYWACSKWTSATRVLAIAVGVLLGAVISLSIIIALKDSDPDVSNIFKTLSAPD